MGNLSELNLVLIIFVLEKLPRVINSTLVRDMRLRLLSGAPVPKTPGAYALRHLQLLWWKVLSCRNTAFSLQEIQNSAN